MNWRGHAVLHALSAACRSAWLDDQQSKKEELCGDTRARLRSHRRVGQRHISTASRPPAPAQRGHACRPRGRSTWRINLTSRASPPAPPCELVDRTGSGGCGSPRRRTPTRSDGTAGLHSDTGGEPPHPRRSMPMSAACTYPKLRAAVVGQEKDKRRRGLLLRSYDSSLWKPRWRRRRWSRRVARAEGAVVVWITVLGWTVNEIPSTLWGC